jgi:outer membrane immunogenic protein
MGLSRRRVGAHHEKNPCSCGDIFSVIRTGLCGRSTEHQGGAGLRAATPAFSWTGIYIGINGGYGGDRFVYPFDIYDDGDLFANGHASLTYGGFLAGGQIGFNYQFPGSNFVAGVEADADWSSIHGQLGLYATDDFSGDTLSASAGTHLDYFGTVRARFGYAFGNILPYVTGGFAYGETTSYGNIALDGSGISVSKSNGRDGWTAGAGLEYAITPNVTFKTEYLYVNLGEKTLLSTPFDDDDYVSIREKATFNVVRAGLNWKFDLWAPPAPVVARY